MQLTEIDNTLIINYGSVQEHLENYFNPSTPCGERLKEENVTLKFKNDSINHKLSWFGCKDLKSAEEILKFGTKEYLLDIQKLSCEIPLPKKTRKRLSFSNFGEELDIHKINSGNFSQSWTTRNKSTKERIGPKFVKIYVNGSTNCGVRHEERLWTGIVTLALSDILEHHGYRVEVNLIYCTSNIAKADIDEELNLINIVPIKEYSEYLDLVKLSSLLCFSGYFRMVQFVNKSLIFKYSKGVAYFDFSGLGKSITFSALPDSVLKFIAPNFNNSIKNNKNNNESIILIDTGKVKNQETTKKFLTSELSKFNIVT